MNFVNIVTAIMFAILPNDDFIDLQESYMAIKVKVLKANGSALVAADKVALSNNIIEHCLNLCQCI